MIKNRKSKNKKNTKGMIIARRLLNRINTHKGSTGGVTTEITGGMGSGKTSVMLSFLVETMQLFPKEKFFFSNTYDAPIQSYRIGQDLCNLMVQKDSGVTFHDRNKKLKDITDDLDITYFDDAKDLYQKAPTGICNNVFFGNRLKWIPFLHYLRRVGSWCNIYIDELSEVAPANTSGKKYKKVESFAMDLKEVRKCLINVHSNTQAVSDIDYRVRSKIMIKIFMPGAITDKHCRIVQKAIDNLKVDRVNGNCAWIIEGGEFGLMQFVDKFEPIENYQIEAHVEEVEKDE